MCIQKASKCFVNAEITFAFKVELNSFTRRAGNQ